jgi:hypothetical protein
MRQTAIGRLSVHWGFAVPEPPPAINVAAGVAVRGSGTIAHDPRTLHQRPQLDACLSHLRAGDTLVVWRLDRLERGLKHLIELTRPFRYRFGLDRLPLITIPSAGPGRMG